MNKKHESSIGFLVTVPGFTGRNLIAWSHTFVFKRRRFFISKLGNSRKDIARYVISKRLRASHLCIIEAFLFILLSFPSPSPTSSSISFFTLLSYLVRIAESRIDMAQITNTIIPHVSRMRTFSTISQNSI